MTGGVSPGEDVTFTGTDIARGETVLRTGQALSSREIGVMAAIGLARIMVVGRPRVAILSTGDEIVAPGTPQSPGSVYASTAPVPAAPVPALGGQPASPGLGPPPAWQLSAPATHRP